MGLFDWMRQLKEEDKEIDEYENFEEDPVNERLKEKRWIKVVFSIPLLDKKKF